MSQIIIENLYAYQVASEAHKNQFRKYSENTPYIVHPVKVAKILLAYGFDNLNMIEAALLHDTVEDTPLTLGDLYQLFSKETVDLVEELTDISRPSDGNRAVRKQIDLEHTAKSSPQGATIKLADLIDNCLNICEHDKHFGQIYLDEEEKLLKVLTHGHPELYQTAQTIYKISRARLS